MAGNALIYELEGALNNPGWAIGDTPNLPPVDRNKQLAAKMAASKMAAAPKAAWTSHSLRQFMGLSMKKQTLGVNNESHEVYFELLYSLDLMPIDSEEKEDFFLRLKDYQKENGISIDEMVETVIEMRKNELSKSLKEEKKRRKEVKDYVKPVYVMGKLISTKALEENDTRMMDELNNNNNHKSDIVIHEEGEDDDDI